MKIDKLGIIFGRLSHKVSFEKIREGPEMQSRIRDMYQAGMEAVPDSGTEKSRTP